MTIGARLATRGWMRLGPRFLPFADAATPELPLGRLLRLSLFQVSVGITAVLVVGTLNRVMIVELGVPASLVAAMVSLPLVFAPLRALVGHRSDTHRSALGWRRVPYLWLGTLLQFGGFAIMPFALILLSGDTDSPFGQAAGTAGAAFAFLLVGAGLHTVQTVGLALATDLAPVEARPRVVALLCTMLLAGMVASAVLFGVLLADFQPVKLIQVVQGTGVVVLLLNGAALWKQEARDPHRAAARPGPSFGEAWGAFLQVGRAKRHLLAIGLGTAGFGMQDVLLEPYGGRVLGLTVGATTALTALLAAGGIAGLALAARRLARGANPYRVASGGAVAGLAAFSAILFAAPLESPALFGAGVVLVGFGGGLFAHGTLTASMALARAEDSGMALGAWGAVQASAAGLSIALGGVLCDGLSALALRGRLGEGLAGHATGYGLVYGIEILLLFATLAAIGPLVRPLGDRRHAGRTPLPITAEVIP